MATKKAIVLTNGLFGELNTPTDKLDFSGNTTADLTENTNLYYTTARARSAISVADLGGDGSLSYNSIAGVITYTGPSASEVRSHFSATNSGTGFGSLAYDNSTGVFTYTVVTSANIRQQISVTDSGGDGSLSYDNSTGVISYTGPSASEVRAHFNVAAGSGLTYNNTTGVFGTSAIPNSQLANSSVTFGSTTVSLGGTSTSIQGVSQLDATTINVGSGANSISINSGVITFEGSVDDTNETFLQAINPTADRTIQLPDASGTVALLSTLSVAAGSGLTYNSTTGEFGTSSIPNSQLQNSSITIGSTAIALGSSSTALAGLTSVTSTGIITNDSGFRIRNTTDITKQIAFDASAITTGTTQTYTFPDTSGTVVLTNTAATTFSDSTFRVQDNADATKQLAFECSGISTATTRTMTVPNENGTISTQDFATAIAIALG